MATETTALAVLEKCTAVQIFEQGFIDPVLEQIEAEARSEAARLDISTEANREASLPPWRTKWPGRRHSSMGSASLSWPTKRSASNESTRKAGASGIGWSGCRKTYANR